MKGIEKNILESYMRKLRAQAMTKDDLLEDLRAVHGNTIKSLAEAYCEDPEITLEVLMFKILRDARVTNDRGVYRVD